MDTALPAADRQTIDHILAKYQQQGIQFHALRTRQAGGRNFVSVHVLVPGGWSVQKGHQLLEGIESEIRGALSNVSVFTHLEPLDDVASWRDVDLERET